MCAQLGIRPEDQEILLQKRAEHLKEQLTQIHDSPDEEKRAITNQLVQMDDITADRGESKRSDRSRKTAELLNNLRRYRDLQLSSPNKTKTGLVHFLKRTVAVDRNGFSHGVWKAEACCVAFATVATYTMHFFGASGNVSIISSADRVLFENGEQYDVWEMLQAARDENNPEAVALMNRVIDAQDYDVPLSMQGTFMGHIFVAGRIVDTTWKTVKGLGGGFVGQFISPKGTEAMDDPEKFIKESLSNMTGGGFMDVAIDTPLEFTCALAARAPRVSLSGRPPTS